MKKSTRIVEYYTRADAFSKNLNPPKKRKVWKTRTKKQKEVFSFLLERISFKENVRVLAFLLYLEK